MASSRGLSPSSSALDAAATTMNSCAEVRLANATTLSLRMRVTNSSVVVGDGGDCAPWWMVAVAVVAALLMCMCIARRCCCGRTARHSGVDARRHTLRKPKGAVRLDEREAPHRSLPPAPSGLELLRSQLPAHWEIIVTADQPYFFNTITGESQWEAPSSLESGEDAPRSSSTISTY